MLGYRGNPKPGDLGYDHLRRIGRIREGEQLEIGAVPEGVADSAFGGGLDNALWPNMADSAFRISAISPATHKITVGVGYVWAFTAGKEISAVVVSAEGTVGAPHFIYASGSVVPLGGTIAAASAELASLPWGTANTWVLPLYRVYIASGFYRIMPVFHCPNIRTHYGP